LLTPLISVICCAHNEDEYVDKSVPRILSALKGFHFEIIFVADRCTDNTVDLVGKYNVKIIEKNWKKWENSYAESLQTGYRKAKGTHVSIIDADITVPVDFFRELLPVIKSDVTSVAANVVTYSDTFWNRVFHAWEKTYNLAPLGRVPRGAARVILKSALDDIDGFRDVPTPDTDVDIRLAKKGYKSVAKSAVKVYHLRHLSLRKMISGQINSGRGRYALDLGLLRTIGHGIFRFRPFVICGWLLERQRRSNQ
jgi:cellulose synthase/poly-beta-1,6-N-acetylglucosamine synthase-like glycosyltransferase